MFKFSNQSDTILVGSSLGWVTDAQFSRLTLGSTNPRYGTKCSTV